MNLNDYNGDLRKGSRTGAGGGGLTYRSPNSKDVGPVEPGPYCDKVVKNASFQMFPVYVAMSPFCPLLIYCLIKKM